MRSTRLRVSITALLAIAAVAPAHAFRCGPRIITRGDHADKLLQFCGEPASIQSRVVEMPHVTRDFRVYPGIQEVLVEEWVYNRGPYQLMRMVRLENGFVAEIKSLGYGY